MISLYDFVQIIHIFADSASGSQTIYTYIYI